MIAVFLLKGHVDIRGAAVSKASDVIGEKLETIG
jgi:hypothetical protein